MPMKKKTFIAVLVVAVLFSLIAGALTTEVKASAPNNLGLTLTLPSSSIYTMSSNSAVLPLTIIVTNPYSQYYFLTTLYDLEISVDGKVLSGYPNMKEVNERTKAEWNINLALDNVAFGAHNLTVYVAADFTYQGYGIIPVGPPPEDFSDGSATSTLNFFIITPSPSPTSLPSMLSSPSLLPATPTLFPLASVPEFSVWLILPALFVTLSVVLAVRKKLI